MEMTLTDKTDICFVLQAEIEQLDKTIKSIEAAGFGAASKRALEARVERLMNLRDRVFASKIVTA